MNIKKIKEVIVEQKESDLMSRNFDTVRSSFQQFSQDQLNLVLNDPTTTQISQGDAIDEIVKVNRNLPEPIISDLVEPEYGTTKINTRNYTFK